MTSGQQPRYSDVRDSIPKEGPQEVLEMDPQVDEVVNCLTDSINDK